MLIESEISSPTLLVSRRVWIQRSDRRATSCVLFLDGELYLERVGAAAIVQGLIADASTPPFDAVYLSHGGPVARHTDFTCNPAFARFLVEELVAWIERNLGPHDTFVVCGLSLSGLAVLHAAATYSSRIHALVSQSPSAWWNDEWLATRLDRGMASRIWLSVGNRETQENVTHPPTPLVQVASQLDSCRRLHQALLSVGAQVSFSEFEGGHDSACWAKELPTALRWALTTT